MVKKQSHKGLAEKWQETKCNTRSSGHFADPDSLHLLPLRAINRSNSCIEVRAIRRLACGATFRHYAGAVMIGQVTPYRCGLMKIKHLFGYTTSSTPPSTDSRGAAARLMR